MSDPEPAACCCSLPDQPRGERLKIAVHLSPSGRQRQQRPRCDVQLGAEPHGEFVVIPFDGE
jgi:hypothetical protein